MKIRVHHPTPDARAVRFFGARGPRIEPTAKSEIAEHTVELTADERDPETRTL
jgi:hypothetical protein